MFSQLCDIKSTQRTSEGMHVDRDRAASVALIRRASDRAGIWVIDMQGDMYIRESGGTFSWFNPLLVNKHARTLFDAMHFTVSGRLLTRRLVSPTGANVSVALAYGKRWRRKVVEFAASLPGSHDPAAGGQHG
ncbi:hypothetical protein P3T23_003252 [Paraburkholderia sp. GAS448]|uniref:hypothetical protein n=1 Tax=Paraburkholderia sp. GAS448 TaxID=3035136 RepID=UPI003D1EF19E